MCALISSSFLLFMSVGVMAFAIIQNQFDPSYANALAIPIFNVISATFAFLAAILAVVAANKNSGSVTAKAVVITSILLTLTLLLLVPITDQGFLSIVN